MKILMVTRGLPFHGIGGMEVVAWDLAKKIAELGHDVTILTTPADLLVDKAIIDGVCIRVVNCKSNKYSNKWRKLTKEIYLKEFASQTDIVLSVSAAAKHLVNLKLEKKPFFVLQAHGTSWGEVLSKIRQKKVVSIIKALKNILGYFQDLSYRNFDKIIAIGDAVYKDYSKYPSKFLIFSDRLSIVKNGVDFNIFKFDKLNRNSIRHKFGFNDKNFVFVSCSRLHEQKGVLEALNGFIKAYETNKNIRYIIIGNGPEYENLKNTIRENGLESIVILLGSLKREDISNIYSACDGFIFTTKRNEGLPINVLEACACGLPVFLTEFCADKDFDPVTINDLNSESISEVLINWLKEYQVNEIRRNYLPEKYSLDSSAKKYIEEFEELICKK